MHKSSYLRMEYIVRQYEQIWIKEKQKVNVLDIGSYDVNGTYRTIFNAPVYQYTGMDMSPGPNVDIVPGDIYQWNEIADETFDVVISGQVFEHIEYPWLTIKEIARVLKPSGFCIVIAPSSGMEHKAPKDCYRYYADGLSALAKWADFKVLHVSVGGVPDLCEFDDWTDDWNDACLVAQKKPFMVEGDINMFFQEKRVPVYGYHDIHKLWETEVRRVCRKFDGEKPIALFGAGLIGSTVLEILGADKVAFFIDNSLSKIGKEYRGINVISFDEYRKVSGQYNCLITASYKISLEIRKQLEAAGVEYGMLYDDALGT